MTAAKNDDPSGVRAALEQAAGAVAFTDLRAHLTRDAVFLVAPRASLVDCGVAIATNDVPTVERLIASGTIRRPTAEEQRLWSDDVARRWTAIVVQPYVLVQDPPAS